MKKIDELPIPANGVACPSCHVVLSVSASTKRGRVQCPKCRQAITLPKEPPPPTEAEQRHALAQPGHGPDSAIAELERRMRALELHLATLEEVVARTVFSQTARKPPAELPVHQSPMIELEPLAPAAESAQPLTLWQREIERSESSPGWTDSLEETEPECTWDQALVEKLGQTLMELPSAAIAIRTRAGNRGAYHFGAWLSQLFIGAGWNVTKLEAWPMPAQEHNLVLISNAGSMHPKLGSVLYRALTTAGLTLGFQFDPSENSSTPVLMVPEAPPASNTAGSEAEESPLVENVTEGELAAGEELYPNAV